MYYVAQSAARAFRSYLFPEYRLRLTTVAALLSVVAPLT